MSIKKAAMINATSKYLQIIFQLLFTAILSRILSPEDYGIVAVITVFTTFFSTFADMGFGTAVIQNKELQEDDISSIFSFTVYISIVLSICFALFSFGIAAFYGNSVYIPLGVLLSFSVFLNALNMIPNAMLMREKKFLTVAFRTVIVCVTANIVTILLAYMGAKYYALACQSVFIAFFTLVWNYLSTKPKFVFKVQRKSINKVLRFSSFQFGFNVVNYFSRNLDNLLTGKFLGDVELGYYNKAYTLMLYPVNNLSGVISPVLHPMLSDYQHDKEQLYQKFIKAISIMALLGIFIAPYCWLNSKELIYIMFGNQWGHAATCFQYLSLAICTQMMNPSAGAAFQSLGNTKLLFINSLINTAITVCAILIGVLGFKNIEKLAICVAMAYIIHFFTANYMLLVGGFQKPFRRFLYDLRVEIGILVTLIIAVMIYPFHLQNIFASIVVKTTYLGIIYLFLLILTNKIKFIVDLIGGVLRKK